ncbi:MAG: ornithine cyclodeaminase family protein [Chloroflexi bacterium]|nr:ornithine cyclodeaminase family protein [Chloroflexota bacterium]
MPRVIETVTAVFAAFGRHEALMPPKVYLDLPQYAGDFRAMPAYVAGAAGVKWVNSHPENPKRYNLPTVMAVLILNDPATARPLAIMDGTIITQYRTGAAAAVATQHLARPDARSLGVVGCGAQAIAHVEAITAVRTFEEIRLFDVDPERARRVAAAVPQLPARVTSIEATAGADVVLTLTPVTKPIVRREWVKPGAHVNAMGADAAGKQELDSELTLAARVFVDAWEQASHSGEINVLVHQGRLDRQSIAGELGEVVAGLLPGRLGDEITIFDSTGLAVQDIATAKYLYEEALKRGVGTEIELL